MKYRLKIDVDCKLSSKWLNKWKESRKGLLKSLGFEVKKIKVRPSSERGFHSMILIDSDKELSPMELNLLQGLSGDDWSRVKINASRIKRGIDWSKANKLFSKVIYRAPKDKERKRFDRIIKKKNLDEDDRRFTKRMVYRLLSLEKKYRDILSKGQEVIK